jgi:hypothetical protein
MCTVLGGIITPENKSMLVKLIEILPLYIGELQPQSMPVYRDMHR